MVFLTPTSYTTLVTPEVNVMSDGETEDKPKVTVEHVTIKMPDFMESAVMGWFKILEAQFTLKGVTTSATKFLHVLASRQTWGLQLLFSPQHIEQATTGSGVLCFKSASHDS